MDTAHKVLRRESKHKSVKTAQKSGWPKAVVTSANIWRFKGKVAGNNHCSLTKKLIEMGVSRTNLGCIAATAASVISKSDQVAIGHYKAEGEAFHQIH